jgi:hypothetical protein
LTKFGNADEDLFDGVRNAEANVNFADDEIDVLTPRGQCYLTKRGNANAGYLTGEEMLDVEGVGV